MNIKSEESTYLFCQLLNEGSKDVGTSLFVEHLYKSGQLNNLKALFDRKIEITNNEDIPYLIAIESVLEKFAFKFNNFLANIKKQNTQNVHRDIRVISDTFLQLTKKFQGEIYSAHSLEKLFNVAATYVKASGECLSRLIVADINLVSNLKSALEFFKYLKHLNLSEEMGTYLCYKKEVVS